MKKRHKFHKFLNSVVKSHGDIEEDWKEIENSVKKMLDLFENNSEDASERSDFVSLVNDIKKRYYALYGQHDGLICKLKNKVQHRKGEYSSGSSGSASEDSSDDDRPIDIEEQKLVNQLLSMEDRQSLEEQINILCKRNSELESQTVVMHEKLEESQHLASELIEIGPVIVKLKDELQSVRNSLNLSDTENESLKAEIEKSKEQRVELSLMVSDLREENEAFISEKERVSSVLLQADNSIIELKLELEKIKEDSKKLREDNSFLKEDLDKKNQELAGLNQQMVLLGEELETLNIVVNELKSSNKNLTSENQNLWAEKEVAIQQLSNQEDNLLKMEGDNDHLKCEILKISTLMHEADKTTQDLTIESGLLKETITKLQDTIADLNHQLQVKNDENYAMAFESSESRKLFQAAGEKILVLQAEAERLKSENFMVLSGHENLRLDLEGNSQKLNSLREENSQILTKHENLKLELEVSNQELSKAKQVLEASDCERNLLIEEKSSLLIMISERGMAIDDLKAQIEEIESVEPQLLLKISNMNFEIGDVKTKLVATEEEKEALVSEKIVVESKLHEAEFMKEALQTQLEELNSEKSFLLRKLEESEKVSTDLKFERNGLAADNELLEIKVKELVAEFEVANNRLNYLEKQTPLVEEEKEKLVSEISVMEGKLLLAEADNKKLERELEMLSDKNAASRENQGLHNEMVEHNKKVEVTFSEMLDLKNKLEQGRKEILQDVQTWIATSKGDLLNMINEKGYLNQEIKRLSEISSENEASLRKMKDRLKAKISEQEDLLESHEELLTKHKQLENSYHEFCAKLGGADKKDDELKNKEEIIHRLERICIEQKSDIDKWGEIRKELIEKLSSMEAGKVDAEKEIQRLEVQIRLSNQKLKITETEYKEKEENHNRLVAGLQEEVWLINRQVVLWSRKFSDLNDECKQIKGALESGMGTLANDLSQVESTTLESMGHIKKELAECLLELRNLKISLEAESHTKKKLENVNHELALRLTDKEGIILKLKDEASRKLTHLDEKEKELRTLEWRIAESDKSLKEKEREVLNKDEEKREAIRQLCLLIEYHWENHNYLVRYLSSVFRSRETT